MKPGSLRLLALPGSLRRRSCNRRLLAAAVELAPPGMDVRVYGDLAAIPLFGEDLEEETAGGPTSVRQLRAETPAARRPLVAAPEYNQAIPRGAKNAPRWPS